ncbi:MAG TPA: hypothetical protein VIU65_07135 [Pyrinomonadaceae bacterium]
MTKSINKHNWRVAIFFAVIMMLTLPVISYAQGHGNSNGRGGGRGANWKCGKFVNCHDAGEGRLDNRGPRGSRIGRRLHRGNRNVIFVNRNRRFDRDGDGDFDRNDRILRRQQNPRWQIRNTRRNGRFNR